MNKTADRRRRIKTAATARAVSRLAISKERVLDELAKLAFSNMADYLKIGADGQPRVDFSKLTRDQAAAIHEVVVETRTEERDDGPPIIITKTRFKLTDKRGALVDLGKHLGLFKERVEHSGPNGGPVEMKQYSDIEAARLIGRLLSRVTRETWRWQRGNKTTSSSLISWPAPATLTSGRPQRATSTS